VHPPPSPAWANFTLKTECTLESSRYYSVYSVVNIIYSCTLYFKLELIYCIYCHQIFGEKKYWRTTNKIWKLNYYRILVCWRSPIIFFRTQKCKMHTVHCTVYRLYFQSTNAHLEGIPVRQSVPLAGGSRSRPPAHPWSTNTTKLTTKTSIVGWCVFTSMVGWLHSDVLLVLKIITSAGNGDAHCCCSARNSAHIAVVKFTVRSTRGLNS
jgi:hypothetical protein